MQFLIDEGADVRLVNVFKRLGYDARRVPSGIKNGKVIRLAKRESRVLITRDSDFTNLFLYPPPRHAGIIYLGIHPPWLSKVVPPLIRLLRDVLEEDLTTHTFVVAESGYHQLP